MEFGILGPLEVHRGEERVELTGSRQRALLAVLLLRAGEVVPAERLLEDVWADDQPRAGATALRVRISQLRRALGPDGDLIKTRAPGYLITVEAGQLDVHRFERLTRDGDQALDRGEPEAAASLFEDALALWRGPALADFPYDAFAQGPAGRLEELRMAAREQLVAAQLALGRHGRILGELRELVAEYPLRERLWAHLILALYREGRQADALEAYRHARRTLTDQIGIEPGPELRMLEQQVLNQDPALAGEVRAARPARTVLAVASSDVTVDALAAVGATLARDAGAELIVSAIVAGEQALAGVTTRLGRLREGLQEAGQEVRTAAFTSDDPGRDATRLAAEHDVALLLLDAPPGVLDGAPFDTSLTGVLRAVAPDVAIVAGAERNGAAGDAPVVVPFAGHDHDWAALEAGAWLARGRGSSLRLVGTRAAPRAGRRDASRLLASASLALQRGVSVTSESVLADPGAEGVLEAASDAAFMVAGMSGRWPKEGLGKVRSALARDARCPVFFVRRGTSPSGLAPPEALTRFTWTRLGG
jgi:DNA-binding SARP family transcriptional activator